MTAMWISRRKRVGVKARGYALVYLLGIIPLLAVITTLLLKGTDSILRSQRAVAIRTNEYEVMNNWLDVLRDDARHAAAVKVSGPSAAGEPMSIELTAPGRSVVHVVRDGQIERSRWEAGRFTPAGGWALRSMTVRASSTRSPRGDLLHVAIEWRRARGRHLEAPNTEFETWFLAGRNYER
jgi:type II secretory pathway component PulJ